MLAHERFWEKTHKFGLPLQISEVFRLQIWINLPTLEYVSMYSLSGQERSCDYTAEFSFQIHADAMLENQSMCVLKTLIQLLKTKAVAQYL